MSDECVAPDGANTASNVLMFPCQNASGNLHYLNSQHWSFRGKDFAMEWETKPVDFMFVLDWSSSVLKHTKEEVAFVSNVAKKWDFTGRNQMGIVLFDHRVKVHRALQEGDPEPSIELLRKNNMQFPWPGSTNSSKAVLLAAKKLRESKNNHAKVMILLSDGRDTIPGLHGFDHITREYDSIRDDIAAKHYSTISIGVTKNVDNESLLNFVDGDPNKVYKVEDFTALDSIVNSIVAVADPGQPMNYKVVNGALRNQNGGCVKLESDIYKVATPCVGKPPNFVSDKTKELKNANKNKCMTLKGTYEVESVLCDPLDVKQRWLFEKSPNRNGTQRIVNELTGWCLQGDSWDPARLVLGTCPFDDGPDWNAALWDVAL